LKDSRQKEQHRQKPGRSGSDLFEEHKDWCSLLERKEMENIKTDGSREVGGTDSYCRLLETSHEVSMSWKTLLTSRYLNKNTWDIELRKRRGLLSQFWRFQSKIG
jgi:hypothetical protein